MAYNLSGVLWFCNDILFSQHASACGAYGHVPADDNKEEGVADAPQIYSLCHSGHRIFTCIRTVC